jgi:Protein of unknown function (DUF3096)
MLDDVCEAVLCRPALDIDVRPPPVSSPRRHCPQPACCTIHNALLKEHRAMTMTISTHLSPLIAIVVGILILIFPRFLNYFIAVYLIVTGLIGLGVLR